MTAPPPNEDTLDLSPLARLVAEGIEGIEERGSQALDALCEQHPEHAQALRERIGLLDEHSLLSSPRSFGPYTILRTLGEGGMGVVYLARDDRLDRLVALKTLPAHRLQSARATERFRREAHAVAQLQHAALVPIYDVGVHEGTPFFTMEYVSGRTLEQVLDEIRDGGADPADLGAAALGVEGASHVEAACRLVLRVADALEHAHRQGVVHRDVKPSNVLLGEDGRVRLFDFGLARVDGELSVTATGEFAGTPFYVSPEQASPRGRSVDHRTDVYSLGVTLYELLTLERPFQGESSADVLREISLKEPPLPRRLNATVPPDLETICLTALEKSPDRRYQTAEAMADDLRRLLAFRAIRARRPGAGVRAWRRARRRPAVTVASLLTLVVLVGAPLGWWRASEAIRSEQRRTEMETLRAEMASSEAEARREQMHRERASNDEWRARIAGVDNFLLRILYADYDLRVRDPGATMKDVIARAVNDVGVSFADDPVQEAFVRLRIGRALVAFDEVAQALDQYMLAWKLLGDDQSSIANAQRFGVVQLSAVALRMLYRWEELEAVSRVGLAMARSAYGEDSEATTDMLRELGLAYYHLRRYDEARPLLRTVLARRLAQDYADPYELSIDLWNYGLMIDDPGLQAKLARKSNDLTGDASPDDEVLKAQFFLQNLNSRVNEGWSDADFAQLQAAYGLLRERLGRESDSVGQATQLLSVAYRMQDPVDWDKVKWFNAEALDIYRAILPENDPDLVRMIFEYAKILRGWGAPDEALPLFLEVITRVQPGHPVTRDEIVAELIVTLRAAGRDDEARQMAKEQPAAAAILARRE